MKERPILFSGAMVRAILREVNPKTQTRRSMKPQPHPNFLARGVVEVVPQWPLQDGVRWFMRDGMSELIKCPYGKPGDVLLVKEAAWMWCEKRPNGTTKKGRAKWHYVPLLAAPVHYCADHPERPRVDVVSPETGNTWGWRWKSGRFLPKWAVRIKLRMESVRVERLQEISEDDAVAEGLEPDPTAPDSHWLTYGGNSSTRSPEYAYETLWESINGEGSWAMNPWVWVVGFRALDATHDIGGPSTALRMTGREEGQRLLRAQSEQPPAPVPRSNGTGGQDRPACAGVGAQIFRSSAT